MCIGAEAEVRRYVPPRGGTLTLIVVDGFHLKVSSVISEACVYIFV